MLKIKKVVLGISGGVDSAVTALLLKQKGYDVQGVFMQNWDIADETGSCSADEDFAHASFVCRKFDIDLKRVSFVKQYWNEVFCQLIREYQTGLTPNPDVLCNKHVKFNHFFNYAVENLGADAIATGHYARSSFGPYLEHYDPSKGARLFCARDAFKDQTFFLCQMEQRALQKTMFPLGNWLKPEVKAMAKRNGLEKIVDKKESMGICFIGSRNFQDFIREYIEDKPGDFIDLDSGKIVGRHLGIHQWTLGQRACISGKPLPYYIGVKDVENNVIYVVQGNKHPVLYSHLVFTGKPHWIHSRPEELEKRGILKCEFKFQHTKYWVDCEVCETARGLTVKLAKSKRAVTPGQYAVFRKNNEFLGSAQICSRGVSHFTLHYLARLNGTNVTDVLKKYKISDVEDCDNDIDMNRVSMV